MEKVAVTGSTGFIGHHLVRELTARGYTVSNDSDVTRVYHLACPSTTAQIIANPTAVMDTILDLTRTVINQYPNAKIINASSMGATELDDTAQGAYNIAKRCMEVYLKHSGVDYVNYRLPAVYGEGMHDDHFIKRCIDGTAYRPTTPNKVYQIAHVDAVVDALIELSEINVEVITLGKIYNRFSKNI
jgi:nucleoside-diphosphate-sugar epimerase